MAADTQATLVAERPLSPRFDAASACLLCLAATLRSDQHKWRLSRVVLLFSSSCRLAQREKHHGAVVDRERSARCSIPAELGMSRSTSDLSAFDRIKKPGVLHTRCLWLLPGRECTVQECRKLHTERIIAPVASWTSSTLTWPALACRRPFSRYSPR